MVPTETQIWKLWRHMWLWHSPNLLFPWCLIQLWLLISLAPDVNIQDTQIFGVGRPTVCFRFLQRHQQGGKGGTGPAEHIQIRHFKVYSLTLLKQPKKLQSWFFFKKNIKKGNTCRKENYTNADLAGLIKVPEKHFLLHHCKPGNT